MIGGSAAPDRDQLLLDELDDELLEELLEEFDEEFDDEFEDELEEEFDEEFEDELDDELPDELLDALLDELLEEPPSRLPPHPPAEFDAQLELELPERLELTLFDRFDDLFEELFDQPARPKFGVSRNVPDHSGKPTGAEPLRLLLRLLLWASVVAAASSSDVAPKSMRGIARDGSRRLSFTTRGCAGGAPAGSPVETAADAVVERTAAAIVEIVIRCFMVDILSGCGGPGVRASRHAGKTRRAALYSRDVQPWRANRRYQPSAASVLRKTRLRDCASSGLSAPMSHARAVVSRRKGITWTSGVPRSSV